MSDYLDASVLVSLFVRDVHTPAAWAFSASAPSVVISTWTVAEFSSALGIQSRLGRLDILERDSAERNLDLWLATLPDPVTPVADDFLVARTLVQTGKAALRAPDALHLAICLRIGASLATFDIRLADAAREFGAPLTTL